MSSNQNNKTFNNLPKDNCFFYPKQLAGSRWGPGGINRMIADNKEINGKMMREKMAATHGSALGAQALINPQWIKARAELDQIGHKATDNTTNTEGENQKPIKNSAPKLTQPQPGTINYENSRMPTEKPQRGGLLSRGEQAVKVENPAPDPTKLKGLASSRWAT